MVARVETFKGRQLRKELLRLREAAGLSTDDVATQLDWSKAKVSRIETGRNRVSPSDVRLLLDVYGRDDERERQSLIALAREARKQGWWHNYPDVIASPYVGFEAESVALRAYQTQLIPGLLQTEAYLRALLRSVRPAVPEAEMDRRVAARMARQEILSKEDAPQVWVILDETVLRRSVGGPDVMGGQLRHLAEMAESPNVTLQVLPFEAGSHSAMGVPFVILDFEDEMCASVVYLEHLTGELYLDDETDIARYSLVFDYLRAKDPKTRAPQRSGLQGSCDSPRGRRMDASDSDHTEWRKSSRSQPTQSDCVEVARLSRELAVRDSKDPYGGVIRLRAGAWAGLLKRIKQGHFDL